MDSLEDKATWRQGGSLQKPQGQKEGPISVCQRTVLLTQILH